MLIGADALTTAGSAINFEQRTVTLSGRSFPIIPRRETPDAVSSVKSLPPCPFPALQEVLESNKAVFGSVGTLGECTLPAVTIDTGDHAAIKQKPYRLPFAKREEVESQIAEMLALGIIRPSMSPWASPVTLQPKKDSSKSRLCIDFRRVNELTKKDAHPIPNIRDIFDQLGGARVFTTLDLRSGYHQIPIAPRDREKTAFCTHLGLYEYNRLPFGLANAPGQFQRIMNYVLSGLIGSFVFVYLDDIIIYSPSVEEHVDHLDQVLKRLQRFNMTLKAEKCHVGRSEVELLGYTVSSRGITAQAEKTAAIKNLSAPTTVKEVRSFLGTVGYYRQLIPSFALIAEPLTRLTRKKEPFAWGNEQKRAFADLKGALVSPPILAFPNTKLPYALHTDASAKAVGAILTQVQGGHERVIAYLSHQLSPTQSRWSTVEREAYSLVHALDHLRCYLWGAEFTVYTDHRPLTSFFRSKFKNAKLERWALRVSEYGCEIEYRQGKNHVRPDMLSRASLGCDSVSERPSEEHPLPWERHSLDPSTMATDQQEEFPRCWESGRNGEEGYAIEHGFLYSNKKPATGDGEHLRLVLPSRYHHCVIESAHHDVGHQGIVKTLSHVRQSFVWPGMRRSVETFVRSCPLCALYYKGKDERQPARMPLPPRPLHTWGLDLIGPFVPSTGSRNRYVLTAIDHLSGWAEAIPLPDKSSKAVWSAFCQRIIAQYGIPEVIVTDQGGELNAKDWEAFLRELGVDHRRTTAYYPQTNGRFERLNGTIKRIMAKIIRNDLPSWESALSDALWAYRTSYHASLGTSPYRALFGVLPRQPKQEQKGKPLSERLSEMHRIRNEVQQELDKVADKRLRQQQNLAGAVPPLHPGDAVLLKKHVGPALQTNWDAGWTVEGIEGPVVKIGRDAETLRVNRAKLRLMPPGAQVIEVGPRQYRRQRVPLHVANPGDGLKVTIRRVAQMNDSPEWSSWLSQVRSFCCSPRVP